MADVRGGRVRYHRCEPEHTVLHQLVRENLASLLIEAAERYPSGELPHFIQGEFERFVPEGVFFQTAHGGIDFHALLPAGES